MADRRDVLGDDLPDPLAIVSPGGTLISGHPQEVATSQPLGPDTVFGEDFDDAVHLSEGGGNEVNSSGDHEVSNTEDPISSKGASGSIPKSPKKGNKQSKKAQYRPGDDSIISFPKVTSIVPKLNLCTDPVWLKVTFPKELIRRLDLQFFTLDVFCLVPPT